MVNCPGAKPSGRPSTGTISSVTVSASSGLRARTSNGRGSMAPSAGAASASVTGGRGHRALPTSAGGA